MEEWSLAEFRPMVGNATMWATGAGCSAIGGSRRSLLTDYDDIMETFFQFAIPRTETLSIFVGEALAHKN